MKSRALTVAAAASLVCAAVLTAELRAQNGQQTAGAFYVINLGNPGGGTASVGNTINDLGWPMGAGNQVGDATAHATVWLPGKAVDVGTLGGPNSAIIFQNRNNNGEAVGIAETSNLQPLGEAWSCAEAFFATITGHTCVGFTWQNGVMTPLPTLGGDNGVASGVNDFAQVVGWAETPVHDPTCVSPQVLQFEAVTWDSSGQIQRLPQFGSDPDSAAVANNDKGQVVGISGTCDNAVGAYSAIHAVLWENGRAIYLGNLGGHGWNTPVAINKQGQIAGFANVKGDILDGQLTANFHAFLWTSERGMMDLGTLPGDAISEATGINNAGQIVGTSYGAGFTHPRAFIWQDGVMTPLNSLISANSPLSLVVTGDINDRAEITGQAYDMSAGTFPAFLAIPTRNGILSEAASPQFQPLIELPENAHNTILRRHGILPQR